MKYELRELSKDDGIDIYNMLLEIPELEYGFKNHCSNKSFEEYKRWLNKCNNISKGKGLDNGKVPQTVYWLYIDDKPVGMGKLRHKLTNELMFIGGHGGYVIRPSCRGKGYGTLLLKLMMLKAKELGISKIYLTIQNENIPSIKVALSNGGVIVEKNDVMHKIWIDC